MPHPFRLIRLTVVVAGFVAIAASAPHALAAQRTFVHSSPLGNDANTAFNCSLVAPCRSFNAAISVTDPGGEVVILDTAGYGPMTINKSIKVIGPSGVYGGISVLGGVGPPPPPTTGIVINAGDTDVITLARARHLRRARRATAPADRHRHQERRRRAHREVVDRELYAGHERLRQRRLGEADGHLHQRQLPARMPQRHLPQRHRAGRQRAAQPRRRQHAYRARHQYGGQPESSPSI